MNAGLFHSCRITLAVLAAALAVSPLRAEEAPARADRVGITHVYGTYRLGTGDFLNEGADQILRLGSRVIKVYLTLDASLPSPKAYQAEATWPKANTLAELASLPAYRQLFAKPFTTYILTTFTAQPESAYWRAGMSDEAVSRERQAIYELAAHLFTTYRGTGKTFVLQNWEGDWAARGSFDAAADPTPEAFAGMIRWLAARQAGVDQARAENPDSGVRVLHAAEVNLVRASMVDGRPGVANRVLPQVELDLVSYSAWDTQDDPETFRKALDFIASHAHTRAAPGRRGVYVGEFGLPENEFGAETAERVVSGALRTAEEWGCPYIVYWQLYCNEARRRPVEKNDDVRGFWLLKPDGAESWAWSFFASRFGKP